MAVKQYDIMEAVNIRASLYIFPYISDLVTLRGKSHTHIKWSFFIAFMLYLVYQTGCEKMYDDMNSFDVNEILVDISFHF